MKALLSHNRFPPLDDFARDASGSSAIEFAIVASLFFTLTFGIVIYGSYFGTLTIVNHIAAESARASIAGLDDGERTALALAKSSELIDSFATVLDEETIEVTAEPSGTPGVFRVTVMHEFDAYGLMDLVSLLPMPPAEQSAALEISHGGY